MTIEENADLKRGEPFLSRWARVKHGQSQAASVETVTAKSIAANVQNNSIDGDLQHKAPEEPHPEPTLPDATAPTLLPSLDSLTPQSDFSPFMAKNVDMQLRNRAMKKLFTDPHYNVMDRLDTYIDDYSIHTPLPLAVIRQMNIAKTLGLFSDEEGEGVNPAPVELSAPPVPQAEPVVPQPHRLDEVSMQPELQPDKSKAVTRAPT